jgi:hypothetical protein
VDRTPTGAVAGHSDRPHRDAEQAHRRALVRSDEIVQQLAVAKYALTVGATDRGMAAIDAALGIARQTLTDLLDMVNPPGAASYAGALVRDCPDDERPVPPAESAVPPMPRRPPD